MNSFRIGFTGTRDGLSEDQEFALFDVIMDILKEHTTHEHDVYLHHGDCIGADFEMHKLMRGHFPEVNVVIHPSNLETQRAFCVGYLYKHPPTAPLKRNRDIVDNVAVLIAAPKSPTEILRSGTWATIRYARKRNVKVIIV